LICATGRRNQTTSRINRRNNERLQHEGWWSLTLPHKMLDPKTGRAPKHSAPLLLHGGCALTLSLSRTQARTRARVRARFIFLFLSPRHSSLTLRHKIRGPRGRNTTHTKGNTKNTTSAQHGGYAHVPPHQTRETCASKHHGGQASQRRVAFDWLFVVPKTETRTPESHTRNAQPQDERPRGRQCGGARFVCLLRG